MFKKILAAFKKSVGWCYHNGFLRLWLACGGFIGISTLSSCPCCGQPVCPTGISIPILLGAVLAGAGVCRKKIAVFCGRILGKGPAGVAGPETPTRTRVLSWILILLGVTVALRFGSGFLVKAAPKHRWLPSRSVFLPAPAAPPSPIALRMRAASAVPAEKPSPSASAPVAVVPVPRTERPVEGVKKIIAQAPPALAAQGAPKLERMHAVIGPDRAVEITKETIGLVRYETEGFLELNNDIYDRLNLYEGKKVEIEGFVYRRGDFHPDQFVTARLYMWCCAFDASPMGPLCQWDRASTLADGTWIKVKGTIKRFYFKDLPGNESGDIPMIKIETVERIPKLPSPYVYARNSKVPYRSDHRSRSN